MGTAAECMAAAVVNLNNYDSNIPVMYQASAGAAIVTAPDTGVYVQLLGGAVGGALAPVTIGATTDSIITGFDGGGFFDKGSGVIPGLADKAQADFQLLAWSGATTFAAAPLTFTSEKWTQATGASNPAAQPPQPADNVALNIPTSGILVGPAIPEPSTIALGLLGAAALLIRRRK